MLFRRSPVPEAIGASTDILAYISIIWLGLTEMTVKPHIATILCIPREGLLTLLFSQE